MLKRVFSTLDGNFIMAVAVPHIGGDGTKAEEKPEPLLLHYYFHSKQITIIIIKEKKYTENVVLSFLLHISG